MYQVLQQGTVAPTVGSSETTLFSETNSRVYTFILDTANMAAGDTIEIRCRIKVSPSGLAVARLIYVCSYQNIQTIPVKASIPIPSPYYIEFTMRQTTGSSKSFDWVVIG